MKKLILSLAILVVSTGLFAQKVSDKAAIQKDTEALVALYQLDETQATEMLVIQERRYRNLSEIEVLKKSDELKYYYKLRSIRKGTEASIRMMLTEEQMKIFNNQILERRKKEADVVKQMRLNGASKEQIEKALIRMD